MIAIFYSLVFPLLVTYGKF